MKKIYLKNSGEYCLVDDEDFELLNRITWGEMSKVGYVTNCKFGYIHRLIMGVSDKRIIIDHIDGVRLNNQKSNLRLCSHSENMRNRKPKKNGTSEYLGVCWNKKDSRWIAQISNNGIVIYLGSYLFEDDAAKAYNEKAIELNKDFANPNIVE